MEFKYLLIKLTTMNKPMLKATEPMNLINFLPFEALIHSSGSMYSIAYEIPKFMPVNTKIFVISW